MLTENYLKKIKPFISFYKFIYKARFYLISAGVFLAATGASLLGIKGIIYHNVDVQNSQYGDSLNYNAKSIFNSDEIKYEFRKSDDKDAFWVSSEPTKVGTYDIRAVSTNIFGSPIYGEPTQFSITPRKIKPVIENTYIYGESISFRFDLKEGDEVKFEQCEVVDFVNFPKVIMDENSFKFGNANNEDITSCYEVDLTPINVELTPRSISLKSSLKKTYDGTPLTVTKCDDVVEGSLAYNDSIEVTKSDSITNAGNINNDIDLEFNNAQEGNVSLLYNYEFVEHSLTIEKREIAISLPDVTKTYDGKFTNLGEYTLSNGTLLDGHKLELEFNQYVDVCNETYRPKSYKVIDEKGNDVTSNYKITFIDGNVTINPIPLTLKTKSEAFIYDGSSHEVNEVELVNGTLLEGHQLNVTSLNNNEKINPGTYENELKISVVDSTNKDVTSNYSFEITNGTITIDKRPIEISTKDIEVPFNNDVMINDYDAAYISNGTLIKDHVIHIIPKVYVGSSINGSCDNDLEIKIKDALGVDVTSNYDITYKYGKVTVIKGTLKIKTDSKFFFFKKDNEYSAPSFKFLETPVLPAGYKVKYKEDYTRVNKPGSYPNIINFIVLNDKDEDVTEHFNIEVEYGSIVVFDETGSELDGGQIGGDSSDPNNPNINIEFENKPDIGVRPSEGGNNPGEVGGGNKPIDPDDPSNPVDPENPSDPVFPVQKSYTYTSTYKGPIYFKQNTYLDLASTPTKAPNYPVKSGDVNPNLYISNLLNTTNWYKIDVNSTLYFGRDLIPQYVQKFDDEQSFDTFTVLSNKENPSFYFNPYDYLMDGEDELNASLIQERNKGYELYDDFVKQNYLGIEESLKTKILAEIDKYNLVDASEFMTIYNIARYITKYHTHDDYAGPSGADFVDNFLFGDKKSNEFIYAVSTVKMLRAIGIPARVATGFVGHPISDKNIYIETIQNARIINSWVEVYSDKYKGFIVIDPYRKDTKDYVLPEPEIDKDTTTNPDTPENPEHPDNPDNPDNPENPSNPDNPVEPEKPEEFPRDKVTSVVHINTFSNSRVYDGKIHQEKTYYISDGRLLPYDKLVVSSFPSVRNYTKNPIANKLRFKVIDTRNNKDVTSEYNNYLKFTYGTLIIEKAILSLSTKDKSKSYDESYLTGEFSDLIFQDYQLGEGDKILSSDVRWVTRIKKVGSCKNICVISKISSLNNTNAINNYIIDISYGTLTIY